MLNETCHDIILTFVDECHKGTSQVILNLPLKMFLKMFKKYSYSVHTYQEKYIQLH